MKRPFAMIVCCVALASTSFGWAQDAAKANDVKKYHVYVRGCRSGASLVVATNDLNEVAKAVDEKRASNLSIVVVGGVHEIGDVRSNKTPIRYEVFGEGPRRCGSIFSLSVTTTEPNYDEIVEKSYRHPRFTVVSYR